MNDPTGDILGRDGHLTMLALDRYDQGELDGGTRHDLESHVECCARCRARLGAVQQPAVAVVAPRVAGRSTGSATVAYLVACTVATLAAGIVVTVGGPWPARHTATQHAPEPGHNASSYTSVAQEYSDTSDLELELSWGDAAVATPSAEGWFAVVVLDDDDDMTGDTDGGDSPAIVAVIAEPRRIVDTVRVGLPRRAAARRTAAVLCPSAFAVAAGEVLVPEAGCIVRERGGP